VGDEPCETLSGEERERAEHMLSERGRSLWMRSRAVLRALLGRYLDEDPGTLSFVTGEHGKPALRKRTSADSTPMPMQFNLSHSGDLALYAFAVGAAVGVDVELASRPIDEVAVASRTLGVAEAQRLLQFEPDARRREFLRSWVRHEARLKCLGVGIGGADAGNGNSVSWIAELDVGPHGAGAVAAEVAVRQVRRWLWPVTSGA